MWTCALIIVVVILAPLCADAFVLKKSSYLSNKVNGARSMTAVFDSLASLAIAAKLQSSTITRDPLASRSFPVSVVETKQGMYKEYTVDVKDDSNLDKVNRTYKTAEETDDKKNTYWALFAVLIVGSFVIPMVQYYWYVAEEE